MMMNMGNMGGMGWMIVAGSEPLIAWNELMKFKRTFTEPVQVAQREAGTR